MEKKHFLDYFFYPEAIAVVGASKNPGKAGYQVLKNLTELGYTGRIYPINPKEEDIKGLKCYASIKEIREKLELVIITVPAKHVNPVVQEAADRGDVKAIIVVSAGFSETKTPEGYALEKGLLDITRRAGIRLFGPNCTGVINTANSLDTTIEPTVEQVQGGVSIFSQSGGMAGSILLFAEDQPKPLGFSKWAHVGNMCDIDALDVLSYYGKDPNTSVIAMYMEGFNQGRELMNVASKITPQKAILVLKVGRTELGSKAAYSHTGALAGQDRIYDAAFKKCGITRVEGIREMIDTAKALAMQPLPRGNKICILTEAGGPGTMAMDELGKYKQVTLAAIKAQTQENLRKANPPMAIICQPDGYLDITAAAMEEEHCKSLELVLQEKEIDGVILISVPPTFLSPVNLARELVKVAKASPKPILTVLMAGKWVREARKILEEAGLPTFDTPEQAVKAMVNMVERSKFVASKVGSGVEKVV